MSLPTSGTTDVRQATQCRISSSRRSKDRCRMSCCSRTSWLIVRSPVAKHAGFNLPQIDQPQSTRKLSAASDSRVTSVFSPHSRLVALRAGIGPSLRLRAMAPLLCARVAGRCFGPSSFVPRFAALRSKMVLLARCGAPREGLRSEIRAGTCAMTR